jgi:hypothetical protein
MLVTSDRWSLSCDHRFSLALSVSVSLSLFSLSLSLSLSLSRRLSQSLQCLGDQQSALVGQLCFAKGDAKNTCVTMRLLAGLATELCFVCCGNSLSRKNSELSPERLTRSATARDAFSFTTPAQRRALEHAHGFVCMLMSGGLVETARLVHCYLFPPPPPPPPPAAISCTRFDFLTAHSLSTWTAHHGGF